MCVYSFIWDKAFLNKPAECLNNCKHHSSLISVKLFRLLTLMTY